MNACTATSAIKPGISVVKLVTNPFTAYNGVSSKSGGHLGPEALWIQQIAGGDTDAFEQLCRAFQNRLFGYLYRMLNNREKAEEVLNEVFLGIWQGAARFKGEASPTTWIFRIARNRAATRLAKGELAWADDDKIGETEDPGSNVEDGLVRKDLVHAGLKKLSREHREVVELTFFLGLSYKEIADVVDCPVNTVKTRMFHAKQQLRTILERTSTRGLN